MFWKRQKPVRTASEKETASTITFDANDNPYQRAEKIWYALGMANDRLNMIPRLASILYIYRDLDGADTSGGEAAEGGGFGSSFGGTANPAARRMEE